MSDSTHATNGVADHPLVLTSLVLYSIVLGLPLSRFPPIDWPKQSDLFITGVVMLLLVRMALTFQYAAVATRYPGKLFVLEVAIAVIAAWQFRVLLDERVDGSGSRLWMFYLLYLALLGTMILWSRILVGRSLPTRRLLALRGIGLATGLAGLVLELPSVPTEFRLLGRWCTASVLMTLTIIYAMTSPWRQFDLARAAVAHDNKRD